MSSWISANEFILKRFHRCGQCPAIRHLWSNRGNFDLFSSIWSKKACCHTSCSIFGTLCFARPTRFRNLFVWTKIPVPWFGRLRRSPGRYSSWEEIHRQSGWKDKFSFHAVSSRSDCCWEICRFCLDWNMNGLSKTKQKSWSTWWVILTSFFVSFQFLSMDHSLNSNRISFGVLIQYGIAILSQILWVISLQGILNSAWRLESTGWIDLAFIRRI